jgi:putative hemolysin
MVRALFVLVAVSVLALAACGGDAAPTQVPATVSIPTLVPTDTPVEETFESPLDMANPASVYCEEQGYELEIRDEAGGQAGYCLFPDGSECEEWAFYRGECAPAETTFESPLGLPNPASQFCVEQGYELEIRDEAGGQVGYCLFPEGSECEEWAFYRGECSPGVSAP